MHTRRPDVAFTTKKPSKADLLRTLLWNLEHWSLKPEEVRENPAAFILHLNHAVRILLEEAVEEAEGK